MEKEFDEKEE